MSRTVIALVVCLLVAGCAAPTAPSETTAPAETTAVSGEDASDSTAAASATATPNATADDPEDGDDIAVSGGSLPVDHERTFDRTARLLGANVSPPSAILIQSPDEIQRGSGRSAAGDSDTRSFVEVVGIGQERANETGDDEADGSDDEADGSDDDSVSVAAYVPSPRTVYVNERVTDSVPEQSLERTLAHEFVHTVQFRQRAFQRAQDALELRSNYSRDRYLTYVGVVEGAAVFTASEYDRRYLEGHWPGVTDPEQYRSSPSGAKYTISRYYYGNRYLQDRYDSPENLTSVYDDPPRTTEQLLHNHSPDAEPPKSLNVSTEIEGNWSVAGTNTNGELFTRIALGTQLNDSRAAAGADGWGADRQVTVDGEERSYVWATRWDSRAEAAEFEGALVEYLDSRANATEDGWTDGDLRFRAVRTDAETVVLLAGTESFVDTASVSGTNESVSVSASGSAPRR